MKIVEYHIVLILKSKKFGPRKGFEPELLFSINIKVRLSILYNLDVDMVFLSTYRLQFHTGSFEMPVLHFYRCTFIVINFIYCQIRGMSRTKFK